MLSTFTFFQPAASRFQLPVHKDVSQKTCDNKEQTTPCVPILVSQITHTRNKCTKNEQQCAEHDKQNTKILFHCIYRILIVFIQISHKITTFSSNYETFQQDFLFKRQKSSFCSQLFNIYSYLCTAFANAEAQTNHIINKSNLHY